MGTVATILVVVFLIIFILGIIGFVNGNKKKENLNQYSTFEKNEKKYFRAMDSTSVTKVNKTISELEQLRNSSNSGIRVLYDDDIRELKEYARDLERDKWERKADGYLEKFYEAYYGISTKEFETFKDVDYLFKDKSACLRNYKKYYALNPAEYHITVNLQQYFRKYIGKDYEPWMDSYEELENKLNELTDHMKPVLQRKKKLKKQIMEYIKKKGSVKQADFYRKRFDGCTEQELKCCYRELQKENKLVALKFENRIVITLSDKELSKQEKRSESPEKKSSYKIELVEPAYTVHLSDNLYEDEEKRWFKKAGKHLATFAKCYKMLRDGRTEDFKNSEHMLAIKKQCIDEWHAYYSVDLYDYEHKIYPKQYLRKWMGSDYDPCMEESLKLDKQLSTWIKNMRPENTRVQITVNQDEHTNTEVIETKTDQSLDKTVAVNYLNSNNCEIVDKTDKGGSLYFYDPKAAEELKKMGFHVQYAKNGTKGTEGRSAWYIKL